MSLKLAPSDYEIYIPIGEWIEGNIKEWLFEQRPLFKKISAPIDTVLNSLDSLFNFIPFPIILLIFVIFAYRTNGIKFAIFSFLSLLFIDLVDLWSESMTTLAMIFTAVLFCMLIGIPLGDIAAQNLKMNKGEKSEKAIKKHAAEWIKANQSTFDSWIK